MSTTYSAISLCWTVIALGLFIATIVTGGSKFFYFAIGATAFSVLYRIAANTERA